ncbi:MAG: DUF1292 domain-containing protein [Methylocystaceae bacterium]
MANEEMFDDIEIIELVDDEGNEHLFELVAELEMEGNLYKVLIPYEEDAEEDDETEVEVIILKSQTDENGEEFLIDIEDDEEWEKVADAWQELMEEEEDI